MSLFIGVEGGATNTIVCIYDASGLELGRASGVGTNQYLCGMDAVCATLISLTLEAMGNAKLVVPVAGGGRVPLVPLFAAFGACMSGMAEAAPQAELETLLRVTAPWLSAHYYLENDSLGSIYSAAGGAGGCVIIAGTGSIAQLVTGEGKLLSVGGHGHMYGDEGSAWSIASTAIRSIFADADGFSIEEPVVATVAGDGNTEASRPPAAAARAAMLDHFAITDPQGMLSVMYGGGFEKSKVASFARRLAALAVEGDAFALWIFTRIGRELGAMARALATRAGLKTLTIVAVGSVWKSWPLLEKGFSAAASAGGALVEWRLVKLTDSSAVGAAWRAARGAGFDMPLNTDKTTAPLAQSGDVLAKNVFSNL